MDHTHCNSRDSVNFIAGAILGATIGAAIGILFAPQSGKETRKQLKQDAERNFTDIKAKIEKIEAEKIQPLIDQARASIEKKVNEIKNDLHKTLTPNKSKGK
jgi:gas vesicle protein